jgi:predicted ATPase
MITRIEIDGFKSFDDFVIDLTRFHVLIGTNAAGKSNLCEALTFFRHAVSTGKQPYAGLALIRGTDVELFHQYDDGTRAAEMRIAVTALMPATKIRARERELRCELRVGWVPDVLDTKALTASSVISWQGSTETVQLDEQVSFLRMIENLAVFHWEDQALRAASVLGRRETLDSVGNNLPGQLRELWLRTSTEDSPQGALPDVRADLATIVREVNGFRFVEDQDRRDVRLRLADRNGPEIGAEIASGGTLRTLATLAVLHDPSYEAGMVIFEEPENGIFPDRLRDLLTIMRELTYEPYSDDAPHRQVLLTSHSPVILDVVPREEITLLDTVTRIRSGRTSRVARARSLGYADTEREPGDPVLRVSEPELDEFRAGREVASR